MPLRNPKAKGSRAERKSKALLEKEGYSVTKAAGSLGVFDLVCIGKYDVLLVQVKAGGKGGGLGRMAPADRAKALAIPTGPFVQKLLHIWPDYAREPIVINLNEHVERELHPPGQEG